MPIALDPGRIENTAVVAEQAVASGDYRTAVLAVADHKGIVWRHVVPGDDGIVWDSIFSIASITKPIVVAALMQLVERGRAVLSDPVAEYIPEFAKNGKERVTLWHLITHTSGLDEPEDLEVLFDRRECVESLLSVAYQASLGFEPGTRWSYGFLTFMVLGELITRISGQPYPTYLDENIFTPLSMNDTSFDALPERLAPTHVFKSDEDFAYFNALATPGAGLYSTADDLVTFGRTFLNGGKIENVRLLSDAAVRTMTRTHTEGIMAIENGKPRPTYAGLGWGMRSPCGNVLGSERAYGHAGASGSWLWVDPEYDLVFALLSNTEGGKPGTPIKMLNAVYGALG